MTVAAQRKQNRTTLWIAHKREKHEAEVSSQSIKTYSPCCLKRHLESSMTARKKTGSALPAPRPPVHELDCDGLRACRAASAFGPPLPRGREGTCQGFQSNGRGGLESPVEGGRAALTVSAGRTPCPRGQNRGRGLGSPRNWARTQWEEEVCALRAGQDPDPPWGQWGRVSVGLSL